MRRRASLAALAVLPGMLLAACAAPGGAGRGPGAQPVHVVFFEDDTIALGPSALQVVQDAAAVSARFPSAPVRVLGFVAPDPAQAPVAALASARAERVAAELARFGVPPGRIAVQGRGPVPFDAVPVESRRVEIRIGSD